MMCGFFNGYYKLGFFPYCWLILGEYSTIFLEGRWFLINFGYGDSPLLPVVNVLFALIFGITRAGLYGWGLYGMITHRRFLYMTGAPELGVTLTLVAVTFGYGLNLFWFMKIVMMALRPSGQKQLKEAHYE